MFNALDDEYVLIKERVSQMTDVQRKNRRMIVLEAIGSLPPEGMRTIEQHLEAGLLAKEIELIDKALVTQSPSESDINTRVGPKDAPEYVGLLIGLCLVGVCLWLLVLVSR